MTTLGRILFALPFGLFGINHLLMVDFYIGQLTSFIPGGGFTIVLTGLCLIAASISIITKRMMTVSSYLLALMLILFILTIHVPGIIHSGLQPVIIITALKDLSLLGGSLLIAGLSHQDNSIT
jgi:uncharacterized membrane protein YphA (DoxX/SURF4 family)